MKMKSETISDKLGNTVVRVELYNKDGTCKTSTVSLNDYVNALSSSVVFKEEEKYIPLPKNMPKHYYDGMICDENSFKVILHYNAKKRILKYDGRDWLVPFPSLVFYYEVKKGAATNRRCFATLSDDISGDTPLYCYPFGNVGYSGSMCYGNILVKDLNFDNVEELVDLYFEGMTNDDYYGITGNVIVPNMRQVELLQELEKRDTFPTEWLLPTSASSNKINLLFSNNGF